MADVNARVERLLHCNTARGNTEPIVHCHCASAEMEEEEDLESSYALSGRTKPSLSYTATTTCRARSGIQLTPMQVLAMAQELLRYHPTDSGHEGWLARITEHVAITNEDPDLGARQGIGALDPPAGHQGLGEGHTNANPKKAASRVSSSLAVSLVSASSSEHQKMPASRSSTTGKTMTASLTTSGKRAKTSRSPVSSFTTPGASRSPSGLA
jgi:hypothetical protein